MSFRLSADVSDTNVWQKLWDEENNCYYYFNSATGESIWEEGAKENE